MATTIERFNVGLYEEHSEEAAFLYEQRWAYLTDQEVDWPALQQWDDRLDAHLDALAIGGVRALDVCLAKAGEGAGAFHAALRLCCRLDRRRDVFELIEHSDPSDSAATLAAARALCIDLSPHWRDDLVAEFAGQPKARAVYAHVIGYRRVAAESVLVKALDDNSGGRLETAWALGRVGAHDAVPALRAMVSGERDGRLKEVTAVSLMRLGDEWPLSEAVDVAATHGWAPMVLAIGGGPRAASALRSALQGPHVSPGIVLALGLLGDLGAVKPLLELLGREELAPAAAVALNTITGAELHARVFVPYVFDVDELDDEERAAYDMGGSLPLKGKEPYGSTERVPLLDAAAWQEWLEQNRHRFRGGLRWRMGQPHGPEALVRCLEAPTTPHTIRSATCDELVARYRLHVPFEVDLPIPRQRLCLSRVSEWAARHAEAIVPGRWYFAGDRRH